MPPAQARRAMYHKAKQGEHLSGIARLYGFYDYLTVWQHSDNAKLRQKRGSPNILLPGDIVFIPDKTEKLVSRTTNLRHSFRLTTRPLFLRIVLDCQYQRPQGRAKCELWIDVDRTPLVTSEDGELKHPIQSSVTQATLVVQENADVQGTVVATARELPLRIGYLDPIDEPSGWLGRLTNLGYYRGPAGDSPDPDELRSAVEEFQCDNGLAADGVCGRQTQAKLKSVHGC